MAYSTAEARRELLEELAAAAGQLGAALSALGAAYEQLDELTAERLEENLFGPVQRAYGRAKSTHTSFAARHGLPQAALPPAPPATGVAPSTGASGLIEAAVDSVARGDAALAEIQDTPSFAEVGDVELRAGITGVRQLLGEVPRRAHELARTLGR